MKNEIFNCRKCRVEIGGHNEYCHDGMCDDCFFREYFPKDQKAYEDRIIRVDGKVIDPVGLTEKEFEKELKLTKYIETKEGEEDRFYVDAFFAFIEKTGLSNIIAYKLYDEEINGIFDLSLDEIRANLHLEYQNKGIFFDEDICVSQAFTDAKSFSAIVQKGIIFFSGDEKSSGIMKEVLNSLDMKFFMDDIKEDGTIK